MPQLKKGQKRKKERKKKRKCVQQKIKTHNYIRKQNEIQFSYTHSYLRTVRINKYGTANRNLTYMYFQVSPK